MLQVFYLDVEKVDLDIAYTSMLKTYVSSVFHMFHTYVSKCFIWMLHMFAMLSNVFQAFSQMFQTLVSSVTSVFFCMLQLVASGCFKGR
jgi:hypothetical protein